MTDNSISKVFADRLLAAEKEAGLTSAELSRRSGLTKSHISHFERGLTKNPTLKSVIPLAQALGCTIDYLCGLEDNLGIQAAASGLPDEDIALIRTLIDVLRDGDDKDGLMLIGDLVDKFRQ